MIVEKYVMADLRNWTKVSCLNKTFYKRYMHLVARINWGRFFQGWKHFSLVALITLPIFVLFPEV